MLSSPLLASNLLYWIQQEERWGKSGVFSCSFCIGNYSQGILDAICYNKSIEWLKSVLAHIRLAPELSSEKCTSVCKIGPKKYRQAEARSWGFYKKQAEFFCLETNHENFKVWLQMWQHVAASDASMRNPTESLCLLTTPQKRRCSRITSAASPCVMKKLQQDVV